MRRKAVIAVLIILCFILQCTVFQALALAGMQAGVGAVIAVVVYEMGSGIVRGKSWTSNLIMAGAFLASCVFGVNVVLVVIVCGLIGVVRTVLEKRRAKE